MRSSYGDETGTLPPLGARARAMLRERGLAGLLGGAAREARARAHVAGEAGHVLLRRLQRKTFAFAGDEYPYFYHRYNTTWANERIVEIPIARRAVEAARGRDVLEVGNVLAHYDGGKHDVVDKYETAPGVVNVDVVDYQTAKRYDLIVSVSTLEHVGYDEPQKDPTKTLRAVEHLRTLLKPGGRLLVTVPLGYNPHLDALLRAGKFPFTEVRTLQRTTADNAWREAPFDDVKDARYGAPFPAANAILVGTLDNKKVSP